MKRCCSILICALLFCGFAVPAIALDVQWPPPAYDMPRTVLTVDTAESMLSGLKISMGAVSDTGFRIMGVLISVSLIGSIFYGLVFDKLELLRRVRNKEFSRRVNTEDRRRNLDSIVEDQVGAMEVSYLAKKRFRLRHPGLDLEEAIYKRELSAMATLEFNRRSPLAALEARISSRELGHTAEGAFRSRNPANVLERKVQDRRLSDQASLEHLNRSPIFYAEKRQKREELDRDYREAYGRLPNDDK